MSNTLPTVQQGWQCPLCGTVYAPWVYKCGCKQVVSVPAQWPVDGTAGPPPKPVITIAGSGTTAAATNGIIWTHADFQEALERSMEENAAVCQALADYHKGADSE